MVDVKKQAVRSVAVTLGAQAIKFFIGLGVIMVMARLLTPKDYGLVAMVAVFTGLIAVFRDGGLSIVTVQHAEINRACSESVTYVNHYNNTDLYGILSHEKLINAIKNRAPMIRYCSQNNFLSPTLIGLSKSRLMNINAG
jgi:hypothetical protein